MVTCNVISLRTFSNNSRFIFNSNFCRAIECIVLNPENSPTSVVKENELVCELTSVYVLSRFSERPKSNCCVPFKFRSGNRLYFSVSTRMACLSNFTCWRLISTLACRACCMHSPNVYGACPYSKFPDNRHNTRKTMLFIPCRIARSTTFGKYRPHVSIAHAHHAERLDPHPAQRSHRHL